MQGKAGAGDLTDLPHFANFIKAVRSGKTSDLNANVEQLHLSASLAHFANISYRTGRMVHFDTRTERFIGDKEANLLLKREYRKPYVIA